VTAEGLRVLRSSQYDSSSGIGDRTWRSTRAAAMTSSRRSMLQLSSLTVRNTLPAIITLQCRQSWPGAIDGQRTLAWRPA